jgi:hypothetical protein
MIRQEKIVTIQLTHRPLHHGHIATPWELGHQMDDSDSPCRYDMHPRFRSLCFSAPWALGLNSYKISFVGPSWYLTKKLEKAVKERWTKKSVYIAEAFLHER